MTRVRPPAVAGMFYPDDGAVLRRDVMAMLAGCPVAGPVPKAIIAPHAGYIYSGPVAARVYARLAPLAGLVSRVVLLGPVHRVWVPGLALPGVEAFDTPLGRVFLEAESVAALAGFPQVETNAAAHAMEHSLEVQLPFLQTVLGDFKLVPLVVGGASPEAVAEVLEALWGGPETLVVVSSDLSHFLPYAEARDLDASTADAIMRLDGHLVGERACGAHPVNGLLLAARRHGLTPHQIDLRNSGDTAGDKQRVVGYGAFAFTSPDIS
jgi:MEMO1 family protein